MGANVYPNAIQFSHTFGAAVTQFAMYNLEGNFTALKGTIGRIDGSTMANGRILFFGDNLFLDSFTVDAMELPRQIEVDVTGVQQLRIEGERFTSGYNNLIFAFADAWITPVSNVTGVSIAGAAAQTVTRGQTLQLTANIDPANAVVKNVTWSSGNTAVATVSANGLVSGVAAGAAAITVTTVDGGFTASVTVNVVPPVIPVTGVSVSPNGNRSLKTGGTLQLTANVLPTNATDRSVVWSSSNSTVASVSASGAVTAILPGTATITATTAGLDASGNPRTAAMTITVESDSPLSWLWAILGGVGGLGGLGAIVLAVIGIALAVGAVAVAGVAVAVLGWLLGWFG